MSEGLLRQRRNLIMTCVLLWLLKYGGVKFSKVSLAGFDIEIERPEALYLTLWLAFAYFLYRYYQYFSSEGVTKLQQVFSEALEKKCEPVIRKVVKSKHRNSNDELRYSYAFLRRDAWIYKGQTLITDPAGAAIRAEQFTLPITPWSIRRGILLASLDSVFRNSVVTDYILPFVIAVFVLWYCGSNDWNGSFLRFFDTQ